MTQDRITIVDSMDPEANAMLQALYSRSSASVRSHLDKVKEKGHQKFMESFYVGYGHASIGDCGTTTLFFEGISILAAKAIQDHPLFSGQESSTRYIDFETQPMIDPVGSKHSKAILDQWIAFYSKAKPIVLEHVKQQHPLEEGENEARWEKACQARVFDILRAFLPAAVTTQTSWSTNLRQAHEKLSLLRHHPLSEVSNLAQEALDNLKESYPSSFSHKRYPDQEAYWSKTAPENNYLKLKPMKADEFKVSNTFDVEALEAREPSYLLTERPVKTNLPRHLGKYGTFTCQFPLDYGSYRDLQRHRNGFCQIPLLTPDLGFHPWYMAQLPASLRDEAQELIRSQLINIDVLRQEPGISDSDRQYYLPMGLMVSCETVYDLPQMVYVAELRSGNTVHPTLRPVAQKMAQIISNLLPQAKLYVDWSQDPWDIRRGDQDIIEK